MHCWIVQYRLNQTLSHWISTFHTVQVSPNTAHLHRPHPTLPTYMGLMQHSPPFIGLTQHYPPFYIGLIQQCPLPIYWSLHCNCRDVKCWEQMTVRRTHLGLHQGIAFLSNIPDYGGSQLPSKQHHWTELKQFILVSVTHEHGPSSKTLVQRDRWVMN